MEQQKKVILAIDPGANGAIAQYDGNKLYTWNIPETPKDVYDLLQSLGNLETYQMLDMNPVCYMEKVHGRPGGGSSGMFNYGKGYGNIEMALIALKIPTVTLQPQKWMKVLGVGTRGDTSPTEWKNKLKAKAQQLFPDNKLTLKTCDAALIAYYAHQQENK